MVKTIRAGVIIEVGLYYNSMKETSERDSSRDIALETFVTTTSEYERRYMGTETDLESSMGSTTETR